MLETGHTTCLLYDMMQKKLILNQAFPNKRGLVCDYTFAQSQYLYGLDLESSVRYFLECSKATFWRVEMKRNECKENVKNLLEIKEKLIKYQKEKEERKRRRQENEEAEDQDDDEEDEFIELTKEQNEKLNKFYKIDERIQKHKLVLADDIKLFKLFLEIVPRNENIPVSGRKKDDLLDGMMAE